MGLVVLIAALPSIKISKISFNASEASPEPTKKYKVVQAVSPRIQWDDAGGYCGSMSIQVILHSILLVYISLTLFQHRFINFPSIIFLILYF